MSKFRIGDLVMIPNPKTLEDFGIITKELNAGPLQKYVEVRCLIYPNKLFCIDRNKIIGLNLKKYKELKLKTIV